ncbi:MAG TPA: FAD-binding oxidoreductase [Acetobacteraceae bacterium]|jgi:FAD/FMN-containing dehydrogenase
MDMITAGKLSDASQAGRPGGLRGRLTRRNLLAGSLASAFGGAVPKIALARAPSRPSEAAWRHLAAKLSGPVLRSDSFNLRRFARPVNLRYASDLPAAVALCRTADDVAFAIGWCRENDFPLVVQCGGHSYAGFSMRRGALLIDLLLMQDARYSNGTVRIGGGARNRALYTLLEQNNLAMTHGRCSSVGAAGFLLGGGIGFNMRAHGVACDGLVASEIVTADGKIRTLTNTAGKDDADLFWACRGAGGGIFGVNTSFTLATFEARPVTVFDLTWNAAQPSPRKIFGALIKALDDGPIELGTRVSLRAPSPRDRGRGEDVTISLLGQLQVQSAKTLDDILADVYAIAKPRRSLIWRQSNYWDAQRLLDEDGFPVYFQERSAFLQSRLDDEAIDLAFRHLHAWPGTSEGADLRFFQTGGKMNEPAADATAFVHRSSRWLLDVGLNWSAADRADLVARNRIWQDRFYEAMRRYATGAYQNFADPSLGDWRTAYYGDNLARLQRIKRSVDPERVFDFAQAI